MLPKTYIHEPGKFTMPANAILGDVQVNMPDANRGIVTTKPSMKGYKFGNALDYISFLHHEGVQILNTPEFDGTDKSEPLAYDFVTHLAVCGGTPKAEYHPDGTVKDAALLEKGKAERRAYRDGGLLDFITESLARAIEHSSELKYDPQAPTNAQEENTNAFSMAKNFFAQYVAIAQENNDLAAIQTAMERVRKTFEDKQGKDFTEMQDFASVAYLGANAILHERLKSDIEKNIPIYTETKAFKQQRPDFKTVVAGLRQKIIDEEVRPAVKQQILEATRAAFAMKAKGGKMFQFPPAIKNVAEVMQALNDFSALGMEYFEKSQGPAIDGAVRAQVGHCIFTEKGEKVAVSNLESCIAMIIVNNREIKDGAQVVAPKGAMCVTIQNQATVEQIPDILDCFLAHYPGMRYEDLGVYLVGGKAEVKQAADFMSKPDPAIMGDIEKLTDAVGVNAVTMKRMLEFLQTRPVTIEGTCLFKTSQPLAFVTSLDEKGKVKFERGRAKNPRKDSLAIDLIGNYNFHEGYGNILSAPWIAEKEAPPYIAAKHMSAALRTQNSINDWEYVGHVMRSGMKSRHACTMHAYAQAFADPLNATVLPTVIKAMNGYIRTTPGRRVAQAVGDDLDAVVADLTGTFGMFVSNPPPDKLNGPIAGGIAGGQMFTFTPPRKLAPNAQSAHDISRMVVKHAIARTACADPNQKLENHRREQPGETLARA
jgi:hypothetical protein